MNNEILNQEFSKAVRHLKFFYNTLEMAGLTEAEIDCVFARLMRDHEDFVAGGYHPRRISMNEITFEAAQKEIDLIKRREQFKRAKETLDKYIVQKDDEGDVWTSQDSD